MQPGQHPITVTSTFDDSPQPNKLFVPTAHESGAPLPLFVALHGVTATWESWFEATDICEWAEREGIVVLTPHGRGDWFYLGPGYQDVRDAIEEVRNLCNIDGERIFLAGHSMGGWGTWQIGCGNPHLFAAVLPMSCWSPHEILSNLEHTPIWQCHGDQDDVVPPHLMDETEVRLREYGCTSESVMVPGVDHTSQLISDMLPRIGDFIRDRRLPPPPNAINAHAQTPTRGHIHWLHFVETGHFPRAAGIRAQIDGNKITVRTDSVRQFAIDPWSSPLGRGSDFKVALDHHDFDSPSLAEDEVLLFRRVHRSWAPTPAKRADVLAAKSPVIGHLDHEIEDLPMRVAQIIAEEQGADCVVLPRRFFVPEMPAGDITADTVLDLWVHPEEDLWEATMTPEQVDTTFLAADEIPFWWKDMAIFRRTGFTGEGRVLITKVVKRLGLEQFSDTNVTLREVLHNHVKSTGTL